MPSVDLTRCPICRGPGDLLCPSQQSYVEGSIYSILECNSCDLQYASPPESPSTLYENVYRNASELPGYRRYYEYANKIVSVKNPLEWLSIQESAYTFLVSSLQQFGRGKRTLEVGSGLGYMTFAAASAGFDIVGVDVSRDAVDRARSRFGDHFVCADIFDMARDNPGSHDLVILSEVIEHIPEPIAFLSALRAIMRKNGRIVLTTPNKSASPPGTYWATELPPIHLCWFSETAMRALAHASDLKIEFFDFRAGFAGEHSAPSSVGKPWLAKDGSLTQAAHEFVVWQDGINRKSKRRRTVLGPFWRSLKSIKNKHDTYGLLSHRTNTMAAILTLKSSA